MGQAALLPHNYPQLQNLIKRDPVSYRDEYLQQYQHFKSSILILQSSPSALDEHFESLVTFISHVCHLYAESREEFPALLMELLAKDVVSMSSSLRRSLIQCLLLIRKHQKAYDLVPLIELFFRLLRIQDKCFRDLLYQSIVGEVRRANRPHMNNNLNRCLQNLLYAHFDQCSTEAGEDERLATHKILQITIELYRKGGVD